MGSRSCGPVRKTFLVHIIFTPMWNKPLNFFLFFHKAIWRYLLTSMFLAYLMSPYSAADLFLAALKACTSVPLHRQSFWSCTQAQHPENPDRILSGDDECFENQSAGILLMMKPQQVRFFRQNVKPGARIWNKRKMVVKTGGTQHNEH